MKPNSYHNNWFRCRKGRSYDLARAVCASVEAQEILPSVTVLASVSHGRNRSKKLSERYEFNQKPIKEGIALVFQGEDRQTGEKGQSEKLAQQAYPHLRSKGAGRIYTS